MPTFTVEMTGDRELLLKINTLPQRLHDALVRAVYFLSAKLESRVKVMHLSGPTGANTLSVVTGNLRASVHQLHVIDNETEVKGGVGFDSSVPYAAIHEFGGTIDIPEIVPVRAKALHFVIGGVDVFAKRVAAHTVTMPERAPLRTSLEDMRQEIIDTLTQAVHGATHAE